MDHEKLRLKIIELANQTGKDVCRMIDDDSLTDREGNQLLTSAFIPRLLDCFESREVLEGVAQYLFNIGEMKFSQQVTDMWTSGNLR